MSLAALGYQVEPERPGWLLFPRDTRVTGSAVAPFVHGGNTLQERVIPVLHALVEGASRRVAASTRRIEVELRSELFGARELHLRIVDEGVGSLGFMGAGVDVALRCDLDGAMVTVANVTDGDLLSASSIRVLPGERGTRAWFRLEGPADGTAFVTVFALTEGIPPTRIDQPVSVHGRGKASGTSTVDQGAPTATSRSPDSGWAARLPEALAPFRDVLLHLDQHETLFEEALVGMLGGPPVGLRLQRKLATLLADPSMRSWLPFDVEVHDDAGKRSYVKQVRR